MTASTTAGGAATLTVRSARVLPWPRDTIAPATPMAASAIVKTTFFHIEELPAGRRPKGERPLRPPDFVRTALEGAALLAHGDRGCRADSVQVGPDHDGRGRRNRGLGHRHQRDGVDAAAGVGEQAARRREDR